MELTQELNNWITPVAIIIGAIIIGWIFKRVIHNRLKKLIERTSIKTDDLIFDAVESQIIIWLAIGAIYYVVQTTDIFNQYSQYIVRVLVFILIFSITIAINKFLIGLIKVWSSKQGKSLPSTKIFINLVRSIVYIVGLLVALEYVGVSIAPMLTALGVGGLAVSLALKDTLADVFAGLHILLSRKVEPGDFIELEGGQSGYITSITWRNSTIVDRANNAYIIPNSSLSTAIIKNYDSIDKTFSAKFMLGVGYESDLEHVENVTLEVAKSVVKDMDGYGDNFDPILRFHEFGDSSINFKMFFRVHEFGDQYIIIHKLIKELSIRYKKEGINIPFPIRTLYHMNNIKMEDE